MSLQLEEFIPSGGTLVLTLISLVGMWFRFQNKVENLADKDAEQEKKIQDIVKWSHEHEREAYDQREKFNRELANLEGANRVVTEQFKQIMSRLDEIIDRVSALEKR